MTKDLNKTVRTVSRRGFIAAAAGAVALPKLAAAQSAVDALINTPGRGKWDEQFDAVTSRAQAAVSSNQPILSPNAPMNIMQAMAEYQRINANGGWPEVHPNVPLQFGVYDPSVRQLRQRLIVSGESGGGNMYREASIISR